MRCTWLEDVGGAWLSLMTITILIAFIDDNNIWTFLIYYHFFCCNEMNQLRLHIGLGLGLHWISPSSCLHGLSLLHRFLGPNWDHLLLNLKLIRIRIQVPFHTKYFFGLNINYIFLTLFKIQCNVATFDSFILVL